MCGADLLAQRSSKSEGGSAPRWSSPVILGWWRDNPEFHVDYSSVLVEPRPHDCDFLASPIARSTVTTRRTYQPSELLEAQTAPDWCRTTRERLGPATTVPNRRSQPSTCRGGR